jgi:Tti2 family
MLPEILGLEGEPSLYLLEEILTKHVKPIFQANPHPMLSLESGRKLPRTAGGYAAAQDAFEGQVWKEHPGIGNVLLWCVQRIDVCARYVLTPCWPALNTWFLADRWIRASLVPRRSPSDDSIGRL